MFVQHFDNALADAHYSTTSSAIERYQNAVQTKGHQIIKKYDAAFNKNVDPVILCQTANQEIADMARQQTNDLLDKVLYTASMGMKNGFSRSDA